MFPTLSFFNVYPRGQGDKKYDAMKSYLPGWLLFMVALLGIFSASAYDFQVGGIYYNLNGEEVTVTNELGNSTSHSYSGDVVIPSTVTYDGNIYLVTSIEWGAFSGCWGLHSVTIGNSVKSIGLDAFSDCTSLHSVTIGKSVTNIGTAFEGCTSLTSVIWNARACSDVASINNRLFEDSSNTITDFTFGDEVELIPDRLCAGLSRLTSITIPDSVKSIGESTFLGCTGLTTVTLPESLTSIGNYAFSGCTDLTAITLPESLTRIGYTAFEGCTSLTSITIPISVKRIGYTAFMNCTGLTSVIWNARNCSIENVSSYMFANDSGITDFIFGDKVGRIPDKLCAGLSGLTSITIPDSVTSIGESAFWGCSGMSSVTIGKSVTSIGESAFAGCNRLGSVTIHAETPPEIWLNTFDDYGVSLYVPVGCKSKYQAAEYWRNFIDIQEMEVARYTVEVYSSDETMGTVMGGGEYAEGTVATLAAVPASGYYFVAWSDGNTENPRQITVTEDVSLSAEFSDLARLTVRSIDDTMGGVTAILMATPKEGYRFSRWSDGNTENPRTVVVTKLVDLVAEFVSSSGIETQTDKGMLIYVKNRTLYVENVEGDYRVYTTTGQLVYAGHATTVSLADAGVYVVCTSDSSQKVVVK
ncbi:leucine-rich repeat protein [uncultured Barnesiella sp.]|uniref:leucine-rich repeat protein n=1 Tax=uncultured Barnesiella sp. TaxID=584861 RepID=UPI003459C452